MDSFENPNIEREKPSRWRHILKRVTRIADKSLRIFGLLSIVLFSWVLWDDASSIPLLKKPAVVECPNIASDYQFNTELTNLQTTLELFGNSREIGAYITKHLPQSETITFDCVENSDSNNAALMVKIITEGWSKFPRSMMTQVGASNIVFVKNLRVSDIEVSGTADYDGSIYIDIKQEIKQENDRRDGLYAELTANHELYHVIESLWFGDSHQQDRKWFRLNPDSTRYIADSGYECLSGDKDHPLKIGYVTGYATCSPNEDRAETFAYIVTDGYRERLAEWIKTDEALRAKVNFIKEFFHDYYPGFNI